MVLPPAVAGVALLMAFGRQGTVGGLLSDSLGLVPGLSSLRRRGAGPSGSWPRRSLSKSARTGFAAVDPDLEPVAATHGGQPACDPGAASSLPLPPFPALAAGAAMAWARALGEFGAT